MLRFLLISSPVLIRVSSLPCLFFHPVFSLFSFVLSCLLLSALRSGLAPIPISHSYTHSYTILTPIHPYHLHTSIQDHHRYFCHFNSSIFLPVPPLLALSSLLSSLLSSVSSHTSLSTFYFYFLLYFLLPSSQPHLVRPWRELLHPDIPSRRSSLGPLQHHGLSLFSFFFLFPVSFLILSFLLRLSSLTTALAPPSSRRPRHSRPVASSHGAIPWVSSCHPSLSLSLILSHLPLKTFSS